MTGHTTIAKRLPAGPGTGPAVLQMLAVVAALLLLAVRRQQLDEAAEWSRFIHHLGLVTLTAPLLIAHAAALWLPRRRALVAWLIAFGAYPLVAAALGADGLLSPGEWTVVAAASAVSVFLEQRSPMSMLTQLRKLPLTLDSIVIALLVLWTITASSLFIATPDPVNNQPLSVWFDAQRIQDHPLLFAGYVAQFGVIALLIFGYFWICRHVLVRRVLRKGGWIGFLAGSAILWLLYTPLACSIVLRLPLNTADWALIPSELPDPFLPANFRFAAMLWVVLCPIILASERLIAIANAADLRHAQARAELQLLQQQVNPHFLFNTLNTLYALCLKDNAASAQAIVTLSDLLRYAVYDVEEDWVPLDGEVTYLRNYLDLQLLRFSAQCRIEARWPTSTDGLCVPPQLLIMLVENMFKHGVEGSPGPVDLEIDLDVTGDRLDFCCTNTAPADVTAVPPPGLGLTNLRRRLELLCDNDFVLESGPSAKGWTARLQVRLRPC